MRYPKDLKKGGTIGFIAPSFGAVIEPYHTRFENALEKFETNGYKTHLGPNCYESSGIGISSTPKKCAEEFETEYISDKSDVLMSCGGGELMYGILDYINWDNIKNAAPKWFMGYSDNTNITFLLTTLCDTASIYGPCAPAFGMEPVHESIKDAFDFICEDPDKNKAADRYVIKKSHGYKTWELEDAHDVNFLASYNLTENTEYKIFGEQDVISTEGRFIGGCMDLLTGFLGTKYDKVQEFVDKYKEDGFIWFLECCDLNVMSMRRSILQLDRAGWFKYVKAFIIGRPYLYGQDMMGLNQYDALYEVLKKYNVPVIMDADIGHKPPMMPMISGGYGKLKADESSIVINWMEK